jgi:predicted aspartyl protease
VIRYTYTPLGKEPAPFVHVTVKHPATSAELVNQPAQLDTGADRTIIPSSAVKNLGLVRLDRIDCAALDGRIVSLFTFLVQLAIQNQPARPVEVAASEGEPWILLGRDVLNQYRILLDGPGRTLVIE